MVQQRSQQGEESSPQQGGAQSPETERQEGEAGEVACTSCRALYRVNNVRTLAGQTDSRPSVCVA